MIKVFVFGDGRLLHTLNGHTSTVTSVCYSPNGQYLASGSWDNSIRIWNTNNGQLLHTLNGHTSEVSYCLLLF